MLIEIKNRGVEDDCITVCDGLKGLPEAITTVWDRVVVQTCLVRLPLRGPAVPERHVPGLAPGLHTPSEAAAKEQFVEFSTKWGQQHKGACRAFRALTSQPLTKRRRPSASSTRNTSTTKIDPDKRETPGDIAEYAGIGGTLLGGRPAEHRGGKRARQRTYPPIPRSESHTRQTSRPEKPKVECLR
ncbi:transposase [Arthrobacter sp. NPDC058192]|uniref:transposase n=1 Tax=Arthrobacter sp. NPDC058192 TaxID=3346372 RepID=UPI0036EED16E